MRPFIGPILCGLAYTLFGATWCFALNGISCVAVIISLIVIKVQFVAPKTQTSVLNSMFVSVEHYFVICLTCAQEVEGD